MNYWQDNQSSYVEHFPSEINVVSERIERAPIEVTNVSYEAAPAIVVKERRPSFFKRLFAFLFRRRPQTVRVIEVDPIR